MRGQLSLSSSTPSPSVSGADKSASNFEITTSFEPPSDS